MSQFAIFSILQLINVSFSTVKSLMTIGGGWAIAAVVNAAYYGFYIIVMQYAVADFPMWQKIVATFLTNLIGVSIVKFIEEKRRKEKIWKVDFVVTNEENLSLVKGRLKQFEISYSTAETSNGVMVSAIAKTKEDTKHVASLVSACESEYFITEGKEF